MDCLLTKNGDGSNQAILWPKAIMSLNIENLESLLHVGASLSAEKDLDKLLNLILDQSLEILSADAATIFLAEEKNHEQTLRFKLVKNKSTPLELDEFNLPISEESLVGFVAMHKKALRIDDVYKIDSKSPYSFNVEVDKQTGYHSQSLLAAPMIDHRDRLIGVVQIWNKKNEHGRVCAFTELDQNILSSLSSQAAVAIENARLYEEIQNLFEGFIRASVHAIESRDPTTSGHSERVATLTLSLSKEVSSISAGPFKNVYFTEKQLKEINYASLLHDFGKIGVREHILLKAKKLFPHELEQILSRLDLLHKTWECDYLQAKLAHLSKGGSEDDNKAQELQHEFHNKLQKLEHIQSIILTSNQPSILQKDVEEELARLENFVFKKPNGSDVFLITDDQLEKLKIPKGSLSLEERRQIQEHVTHSYNFLKKIPWTSELKRIPDIAHGHHEKLDGTGYPQSLTKEAIPLEAKIMAVTDIFDALVARDRPYKKALEVPTAIKILNLEAGEQKLDADLVDIFVKKKVYRTTTSHE